MRVNKYILYALIAMIPIMIQTDAPPSDAWGWFKLVASSVLAGATAIKALQSDPNPPR